MASFRVAVAGATGLVGRTIVRLLEERDFPVGELVPLASARSAGSTVTFRNEEVPVRVLTDESFAGCDLAFFSAGAAVSRQFAPAAVRHAALVIDNSSAWRQDPAIPLVVPEVNGDLLAGYRGIVANPNCSTIQMVVALDPLHRAFGLETVVVSTYQSVSGIGGKGVRALDHELATGERLAESPFPHPIHLNVLPHIDVFDQQGWSGEERKMINETRKIMRLPGVMVVPTTVRVPVRVSHSESVYARFRRSLDPVQARAILSAVAGVVVDDEPQQNRYPLALDATGRDEVFVGRIRQLPDDGHALSLWIVSDNLRKGAATNAIQIGEAAVALRDSLAPINQFQTVTR